MAYEIQTEMLLTTMAALRYILYFISAVAVAAFVIYLVGLVALCRNEVRQSRRRAGFTHNPHRHNAVTTAGGGYAINRDTLHFSSLGGRLS